MDDLTNRKYPLPPEHALRHLECIPGGVDLRPAISRSTAHGATEVRFNDKASCLLLVLDLFGLLFGLGYQRLPIEIVL